MTAESLIEKLDGGLRVLVADEDREALEGVTRLLRSLDHVVVGREVSVEGVGDAIGDESPDVAMVKLHGNDDHALDLIEEAVETGGCPVVALLDAEDPKFIARAADRGLMAYAQPVDEKRVRSALEIAIRRFAKLSELSEAVDELEEAIPRRATIERAKGILMERHGVSDQEAFEMLRREARSTNRRVHDVASEVA